MLVPRLTGAGALDSMRAGYGRDTLNTFLPQQEPPLVTFARQGDSSVQFIQLVPSLDQPELAGWPLVTTMKVTMQKCDKCPREFCSLINYRRHMRVHRRSLNVDKESHKIRDVLAAFWDKLSLDDAREIASFTDATLKEIPGSSIVKALALSLRVPEMWSIPHVYMMAGTSLLDIISGKHSRFPISSEELLSILDDASENTFLCSGMAEALQKYVFDAEAAKIALDLKNVTASAAFLFEQKLVKAWLAEKDAEALRCQKLLVDEEEAAQKRLAKLLERKKQKKLRQKEQRAREQSNEQNLALAVNDDSLKVPFLGEASSPQPTSDVPDLSNDGSSIPDPVQFSNHEEKVVESRFDLDRDIHTCVEAEVVHSDQNHTCVEAEVVHSDHYRWQISKSPRVGRNSSDVHQDIQALNVEAAQKHIPAKDRGAVVSSNKVWTKKLKEENVEPILKPRLEEAVNQADGIQSELLIGSLTVSLENSTTWKSDIRSEEQPGNSGNLQHSVSQVSNKRWMPVAQQDKKISPPIQRVDPSTEDVKRTEDVKLDKFEDQIAPDGSSCVQSFKSDDVNNESKDSSPDEVSKLLSGLQFSRYSAKAFLSHNKRALKSEVRSGEQLGNPDNLQPRVNQVGHKLWMPVNRRERKISAPTPRVNPGNENEDVQVENKDQTAPDGISSVQSSKSDELNNQSKDRSPDDVAKQLSGLQFSTEAAKAFLAQRWKEAMSADHVKLETPAEPEAPASKKPKGRTRKNPEKGVTVQYIPRQKLGA